MSHLRPSRSDVSGKRERSCRSCRSWLGMEDLRAKKMHVLSIEMLRIDMNRGEGTRSVSQVV